MLRLYEGVLAGDYFERLERFSFWERSIADRIEASTRPCSRGRRSRGVLGSSSSIVWTAGSRRAGGGRPSARVLPGRVVLDDRERQRRRRDVLHPPGPQDRGARQRPLLRSGGDLERAALRAVPGELREIVARRGAVGDFGHSCVVEDLCAQKDACPNRSYYWAGDLEFRRSFHQMVEELPRPEGDAVRVADGRNPAASGRPLAGAAGPLTTDHRLPTRSQRNGHQPAGRFFERSL